MLSTACKIYVEVLNNRLKIIAESLLLEGQSNFINERSCSNNVFTLC